MPHVETEMVRDPIDHYKTHINLSSKCKGGEGTLPSVCIYLGEMDPYISVTVFLKWWIPREKMLSVLYGFSVG